ncbi:MAG: D-alanyl-D-alanine carboxypeptidase family protein, partial [Acidimicrobiia bacterium]
MTGKAALIGISLTLTLTISVPISSTGAAIGEEVARWSDSLAKTSPIATLPAITGSDEIDALIRTRAEARGYRPRELATGSLEFVDGHLLQAEAAAAWRELDEAARAAGHRMRLVAGFRDLDTQRSLFLRRLHGHSETAIDSTLKWSAPPGYSKHHTG